MENPVLFADVPDLDIIRVNDTYYMVSTTMHFSPGCGIMKSKDLVNWEIVNYSYDELDKGDNFRLLNGKSEYSQGSWAANLRYDPYEKMYYMIMTCNTTGKTYFYVTDDIENGKWHCSITVADHRRHPTDALRLARFLWLPLCPVPLRHPTDGRNCRLRLFPRKPIA